MPAFLNKKVKALLPVLSEDKDMVVKRKEAEKNISGLKKTIVELEKVVV
jgi:hypothetical protein